MDIREMKRRLMMKRSRQGVESKLSATQKVNSLRGREESCPLSCPSSAMKNLHLMLIHQPYFHHPPNSTQCAIYKKSVREMVPRLGKKAGGDPRSTKSFFRDYESEVRGGRNFSADFNDNSRSETGGVSNEYFSTTAVLHNRPGSQAHNSFSKPRPMFAAQIKEVSRVKRDSQGYFDQYFTEERKKASNSFSDLPLDSTLGTPGDNVRDPAVNTMNFRKNLGNPSTASVKRRIISDVPRKIAFSEAESKCHSSQKKRDSSLKACSRTSNFHSLSKTQAVPNPSLLPPDKPISFRGSCSDIAVERTREQEQEQEERLKAARMNPMALIVDEMKPMFFFNVKPRGREELGLPGSEFSTPGFVGSPRERETETGEDRGELLMSENLRLFKKQRHFPKDFSVGGKEKPVYNYRVGRREQRKANVYITKTTIINNIINSRIGQQIASESRKYSRPANLAGEKKNRTFACSRQCQI